tara:strand:+ start:58 stop:447 length:390 start_codon:yes stop_codon:yes gene_type:complete
MKNIISTIILISLVLACTPKIDRQSRKYFRREIRDKEVLLYANRESGFSSQLNFTLRKDGFYAFTYKYFGQETVKVGSWSMSGEMDTIFFEPYLDHKLADYAIIGDGYLDFFTNNQRKNSMKIIDSRLK